MKNVFNVDLTNNPDNERIDGAQFITRTLDPVLRQQIDAMADQIDAFEEKVQLPPALRITRYIAEAAMFLLIIVFVKLFRQGSIEPGFQSAPWLYIGVTVAAVVFYTLTVWTKRLEKRAVKSPEQERIDADSDQLMRSALADLEVPEDAQKIDILYNFYKIKNGKEKRTSTIVDYVNDVRWVYCMDSTLCLASLREIVSIPMDEIVHVEIRTKRTCLLDWNKDELPTSEIYKPYKITENSSFYYIRSYTALQIHDVFGDYEILIPNYDADAVCGMLHLSVDA